MSDASSSGTGAGLDVLLARVAAGDQAAFEQVYDRLAAPVMGVVRRVLRDPAQSEEVAQEVMVEVWRTAARYDPARGTVAAWALTMAHRRAVDRVRSAQAASDRDVKVAQLDLVPAFDEVTEEVEASLEREQVRQALSSADRGPARGGAARVLRRLHPPRGGRPARRPARDGQDPPA